MKVNWQLSNQSIRWASSRDYVAAHFSTVTYFLKFSADILFDHGLNSVFFFSGKLKLGVVTYTLGLCEYKLNFSCEIHHYINH